MDAETIAAALGLGEVSDASLNLQGALHDIQGPYEIDDGGVCERTIARVIDQIEAVRAIIEKEMKG